MAGSGGPAGYSSMKNLRFVVSLITVDNDYQVEQAKSAEEVARRLGVEIEIIFADGDAIKQSQQLLKIIQADSAERPDAIVMEPAGGTALPVVARAAASAKIGWAVLNRETDYVPELRREFATPIFTVSADHVAIGRIQGQQFAALLPKGGSVLYIQGPSSSSVSHQRAAGMYETKPGNITAKILKSANWTEAGGYQAASAWLRLSTSHKEPIELVACQNDAIAIGAKKAFREHTTEAERATKVEPRFTGVDGLPGTGQEWVRRGLLAATVIVPAVTVPALELLVAAMRMGSPTPESSLISSESYPDLTALGAKHNNSSVEERS
jgi:ABC-type sugar transport system substrate-binding protein